MLISQLVTHFAVSCCCSVWLDVALWRCESKFVPWYFYYTSTLHASMQLVLPLWWWYLREHGLSHERAFKVWWKWRKDLFRALPQSVGPLLGKNYQSLNLVGYTRGRRIIAWSTASVLARILCYGVGDEINKLCNIHRHYDVACLCNIIRLPTGM